MNPDDNQAVLPFDPGNAARTIAAVPGVASVRRFQGAFVDLGSRRAWIIARPPGASRAVLASQLLQGDLASAERLVAGGSAVVVSRQLAEALHTGIGRAISLPTPSGPVALRIAATSTTLAWSPGVIFIDGARFTRLWGSSEPTAFGVTPSPGAGPAAVAASVRRALGPASGLEVSTAATRQARIDTLTSEGLGRLGEISTLLSLAAILAMAAALASSIWQRRFALAGLRLAGVRPQRLRRILLAESLMLLGAGCITGAALGVFGEVVIDGYLRHVTGFPVAGVAISGRPLEVTAIVLAGALALVALPAWLASRASPNLALGVQQ
jgi:putative ABC transport system permease protein